MWLKLFIVAIIVTSFLFAAIGLKLIFDKQADVAGESCHLGETTEDDGPACAQCQVKEIVDCDEKPA